VEPTVCCRDPSRRSGFGRPHHHGRSVQDTTPPAMPPWPQKRWLRRC